MVEGKARLRLTDPRNGVSILLLQASTESLYCHFTAADRSCPYEYLQKKHNPHFAAAGHQEKTTWALKPKPSTDRQTDTEAAEQVVICIAKELGLVGMLT